MYDFIRRRPDTDFCLPRRDFDDGLYCDYYKLCELLVLQLKPGVSKVYIHRLHSGDDGTSSAGVKRKRRLRPGHQQIRSAVRLFVYAMQSISGGERGHQITFIMTRYGHHSIRRRLGGVRPVKRPPLIALVIVFTNRFHWIRSKPRIL